MESSKEILPLYRQMVLARLFEERVASLYMQGHMRGFCHVYTGQEAVAVGIYHNLQKVDSSITGHRCHAHMLIVGASPNEVMAELCSKETGCAKGRGGSAHMYSKEHNFYGGNAIVGGQVSLGTGLAFAHKYKADGGVAVISYGDGAANQGQVYESFNMASLWKLPAVYVVENNHYAFGTSEPRGTAGDIKTRGDSFGIPTILADGMDLFDVLEKSKEAIEYARSGKGPIILHVDTYRYRGHSVVDPATYRTRDEVNDIKQNRDPIKFVRDYLIKKHSMTENEFDNIEEEIGEIVESAAKFALESNNASELELMTDVIL